MANAANAAHGVEAAAAQADTAHAETPVTGTQAVVVQEHGKEHHAEPTALGLAPGAWAALAMLVLIVVMVVKKVPGILVSGLDKQIEAIRNQLNEAKALRAEAEALRKEYADKIANAEKDAAAMLEHAKHEAEAIVAKASADTAAVIARREQMAQDKIAAAERGAVDELRAKAAEAAAAAARGLIASKHDAKADKSLVDGAIAGI
jgi:F-type H+-transporting ATPase subunit b